MSNIKEQIRQEIERRITDNTFGAKLELIDLLSFIDSLPDENNPEPYNPVYDEDYLNEKIAKATKSWEGVDVDKMLAECRGYEENPSEELEEAAEISFDEARALTEDYRDFLAKGLTENRPRPIGPHWFCEYAKNRFIAGAEWQEKQDLRWAGEIHKNGYDLCKEQMLKDAVEGEVTVGRLPDDWSLAYNPDELHRALLKFKSGDKVKMIIVKQ